MAVNHEPLFNHRDGLNILVDMLVKFRRFAKKILQKSVRAVRLEVLVMADGLRAECLRHDAPMFSEAVSIRH